MNPKERVEFHFSRSFLISAPGSEVKMLFSKLRGRVQGYGMPLIIEELDSRDGIAVQVKPDWNAIEGRPYAFHRNTESTFTFKHQIVFGSFI